MDKTVDNYVPLLFQNLSSFETEDTRFLKVKIWLMHLGENLNGSYFNKESVQDAIPSLANTPILSYIEENSEGDTDFSDHRMVLVKEDGKFKVKYIGQAIGLIPETNNAQFEKRVCDDGVEREFLTCEGLVWQKWDDPINIFNRDIVKAQSMELHSDFEGEWVDEIFHFTKFSFFGACALGDDVLPAMQSATIETHFSEDKMLKGIQEKMELFKTVNVNKGGNETLDKTELLKQYSVTVDELAEKKIDFEALSYEELEQKLKNNDKKDTAHVFSLSANQLATELRLALSKEKFIKTYSWGESEERIRYQYADQKDDEVFAFDNKEDGLLYGFNFSVSEDKVTIDFSTKKRKKFDIVDFIEGAAETFSVLPIETLKFEVDAKEKEVEHSYTKLKEEHKELKLFKAETLSAQREEKVKDLFGKFNLELTEAEINSVKEVSTDLSIEQIEEKLFTLLGKKKAKFSSLKQDKGSTVKIPFNKEHDDRPMAYGGLFEKYSK
ncbi:hypothetical protein [Bacillus atrophaeus]|uniref:hypothetical protein n=1 Tax=Bacillus atrophaeus TaxID=1452 RepID=UPI003F59453F